MAEVVLATRGSALALSQARSVAAALAAAGVATRLRVVATEGDRDRTSDVTALTEVGAFVRAVQAEVMAGRADLAVHSCKDLPVDGPPELVSFFPPREVPWDVLAGASLDALAPGARVGTGSPRRSEQLAALRPDLRIEGIRGNVDTRLARVGVGDFDAVVLAEAGLRRLALHDRIAHRFGLSEMVPAPAQGALAVEARRGTEAAAAAASLEDPGTRLAVETERLVLELTGAGCRAALGAVALPGDGIEAHGFVADERGRRRGTAEGPDPVSAAKALVRELGL